MIRICKKLTVSHAWFIDRNIPIWFEPVQIFVRIVSIVRYFAGTVFMSYSVGMGFIIVFAWNSWKKGISRSYEWTEWNSIEQLRICLLFIKKWVFSPYAYVSLINNTWCGKITDRERFPAIFCICLFFGYKITPRLQPFHRRETVDCGSKEHPLKRKKYRKRIISYFAPLPFLIFI